jgi:hypothetical protein
MEFEKFFIVEARHPNMGTTMEIKVFSTKKEAFDHARQLAKETFYLVDVISKEGLIACASYDFLRTDGQLFKAKDC